MKKDGFRVGKERIRRLMGVQNMLLKGPGGTGSARLHDGRIIEDEPNKTWATDGKKFFTQKDGWCWFFGVIDHFNDEILSWHISKSGDRHEAMRPVADAVVSRFGSFVKEVAQGLRLRTDCGSQYKSKYFRTETNFVNIEMSYTFVRSPESNGIIERFHRTLQEQVFAVNQFADLEEARKAIQKFIDDYNTLWILHRSGGKTPIEMRSEYENNKLKKCA
jgi:transposase InsO family protein